eukprot:SAG31_NODE_4093_length_3598_cov_1.740211_1_plen_59_part_00
MDLHLRLQVRICPVPGRTPKNCWDTKSPMISNSSGPPPLLQFGAQRTASAAAGHQGRS